MAQPDRKAKPQFSQPVRQISLMLIALGLTGTGVFLALPRVLPIFAATIVGGIGSVFGAVLGGFIVGIAANMALLVLPSGYSPAVPFLIILVLLLVRPHGLFGEAET